MKKAFITFSTIFLSFLFIFQTTMVAFAQEDEPDWQDISLTQEEFEEILSNNPANQMSAYATDLIVGRQIGVKQSNSNLIIAGRTTCVLSVVKCGFTVVTVKRKHPGDPSWTTYKTYKDLYVDDSEYKLSKTLAVPKGYYWKVECTHYAKKSLLSTQKFDNASNITLIG